MAAWITQIDLATVQEEVVEVEVNLDILEGGVAMEVD